MSASAIPSDVHRSRLFFGICLALIPTGASFALVSNILVPLKQQFILTNYQVGLIGGAALWGMAISLLVMGPLLEGFGLKNGARLAFFGHVAGLTLMLAAAPRAGDPTAFWMLMAGAATFAAGNGMIEVAGNPLVAALYPDQKTKRLNWFHAFFPIGLVLGGLVGFALATWGGRFAAWPYQIGVIYLPILVYGFMVLPQQFPKTENAQMGIPVGEMFRYTLTNPLFILMLVMMAITTSLELGPMRWIPSVLQSGGIHGILVLVWISGWMVVLRALSGHFVERLQPTGMLLLASILTGAGLFLLSFATSTWAAFGAATIFAWGVAFFFPTMVGVVSEKMPRTGSLGIVLTAGVGLGMAGAVGVPMMGKLADGYLAESLPAQTTALLQRVDQKFPEYITRAQSTTDLASLGYRQNEVEGALAATRAALSAGSIHTDQTANALRAIVGTAIPNEPLVGEAAGILGPAEAVGGQRSFRYVAPAALILVAVFGMMFLADRKRGGYRAVKLDAAVAAGFALFLLAPSQATSQARGTAGTPPAAAAARPALKAERVRVLFLGDEGHHMPARRLKEILPVMASNGIDIFYTDNRDDLNDAELARYHGVMLYNNHLTVTPPQMAALLKYVGDGRGLVVLHCASASFQNSEEFIRLVGGAFKSHGTGVFGATRVVPTHPVMAGVPAWESWEETYIHTKHNPVDRTVLEVRRENGHEEPWTWVRTYGKGRVFYTAWGHDQRTWGQAGFQQMVAQAVRWTAFGTAMAAAGQQQSAIKMIDLEVPLPVYKRIPQWGVIDTFNLRKTAQAALTTRQSIEMMTLRPKFTARPYATEPLIGNVIDFAWDARGRMWAVETPDYPNRIVPVDSIPLVGGDRILILEDANSDGVADRVKVFADKLNLATSIVFANGGVYVGQAPHMLFFKDTNGDDKADERKIVMDGFPRGDTHGAISNLRYGMDNQVWGSVGYNGYRGTVGKSTYGRGGQPFGSGYFRFPKDASDLEYVARTGNNTWGVAFTEDNFVFGSTANNNPTNFMHIPLRYTRKLSMPDVTLRDIADKRDIFPNREALQVDQFGAYTAGAGHEFYTARAFPKEYWNRVAFVAEPTAHLIGMFEMSDNGSAFRAKNRWSFMASRDEWQAPVQVKVGPDGAVWVSDFYTLVAQHNPTPQLPGVTPRCCTTGRGAAYETPNRDKLHGRIYRISYDSARAAPPMRLDNATPAQLVRALTNNNMFWRLTAQRLLVERGRADVVPALVTMANDQTVDELGLNPGALHALWTLHGLGAIGGPNANADALKAGRNALTHPSAALRRAALQVLPRTAQLEADIIAAGILADRSSPWPVDYTVGTDILQDANAHVRLEALLALSEVPQSQRGSTIGMETISFPANARDPWIPDAVAIAMARQGVPFVLELAKSRPPAPEAGRGGAGAGGRGGAAPAGGGRGGQAADISAAGGAGKTLRLLAIHHASLAQPATVVQMIGAVPTVVAPVMAVALLDGIATGWPEGQTPQFSPEQKAALVAAARNAPPEVAAQFTRVAARWALPTVFQGTPGTR